jgi:hypothetical protein
MMPPVPTVVQHLCKGGHAARTFTFAIFVIAVIALLADCYTSFLCPGKRELHMIWTVGLTDHPERCRVSHGNPPDWRQIRFDSEREARDWERCFAFSSEIASRSGTEWLYGYWYSKRLIRR